jgi:hypothetical protein
MRKTNKSDRFGLEQIKGRAHSRVAFDRRPATGEFFQVRRTETAFGPIGNIPEDTVSFSVWLEVLDDSSRDKMLAQLALEVPRLQDPDLRRWMTYVAKKITTEAGAPLELDRDDAHRLLALVRMAVGLDDLLRALEQKDAVEARRLRVLYGAKTKEKKKP